MPVDPAIQPQPEATRVPRACATRIALADIAPDSRRGGDLRVMLSPRTAGATAGFMGALRLEPGESVSEHRHPYSEEFLYVVTGSLLLRAGGEEILLGPDVAALTPKDVPHRLENHSSVTALVVFCLGPLAPRPELGHVDTEPLPAATLLPGHGPSA